MEKGKIEVLELRVVRSGKVGRRGLWVALLSKLRCVWLIFERCMLVMATLEEELEKAGYCKRGGY